MDFEVSTYMHSVMITTAGLQRNGCKWAEEVLH